MYNLDIANLDNFYVGEQGWLVHNCDYVNPNLLNFSQRSAGGNGRANLLRVSMLANGWNRPAIDVVKLADGTLVTIDNTRVAIARELGIESVPANMRGLMNSYLKVCWEDLVVRRHGVKH